MTHRRPTIVATAVLAIGVLASLAGNVQAINLDNKAPGVGAHISAVFWPVALFAMVELLLHTPWLAIWRDRLTKGAAVVLVAGVAAWVSYWHLANVLSHYGYDVASRYAGPLAIDAAMVLATLALNRVGHARRAVATVQGWTDDGHGHEEADCADVQTLPAPSVTRLTAPVWTTREDMDDAQTEDSMWERLEAEFASTDAPVSPAPVGEPEPAPEKPATGRTRLTTTESLTAMELAQEGKRNGLKAGEISELLGGYYGVSARTIRRQQWWVQVMASKHDTEAS